MHHHAMTHWPLPQTQQYEFHGMVFNSRYCWLDYIARQWLAPDGIHTGIINKKLDTFPPSVLASSCYGRWFAGAAPGARVPTRSELARAFARLGDDRAWLNSNVWTDLMDAMEALSRSLDALHGGVPAVGDRLERAANRLEALQQDLPIHDRRRQYAVDCREAIQCVAAALRSPPQPNREDHASNHSPVHP